MSRYPSPAGLKGGYDIIYQYTIDGVVLSASTLVRVDIIGDLEISNSLPARVCKNDDPYEEVIGVSKSLY